MTPHYYNEIDPYPAQWLRNLMAAGHIPTGDVDERSITDVQPDDLHGYVQCHFFAGIGGWPLALKLAGWPVDRPVWTGSCPCQPFSTASRGRGGRTGSDKHLWPHWFRLIRARRPVAIFGEQVANALDWLSEVRGDMEGSSYAFGASDIPACAVGADHIRPRIWFLAHTDVRAEHVGAEYAETQVLPWRDRICSGVLPENGVSRGLAERSAGRGFGNAIVPQVAAEVIAAYMECRP